MSSKRNTVKHFKLSHNQCIKIDRFIQMLKMRNKSKNIVGKSTLIDPWKSHILDSLQISSFIPKKNCSILDLGTGPGIPGLVLAMYDFTNVSLVDSNLKKISFIKTVCSKLNIKTKIYRKRIEMLTDIKSDFLVSRALANLNKLFFYSQNFLTKKTILIFLKGKTVKKEIADAQKLWKFQYKLKQSLSDKRGSIVVVSCLNKINV